MAPPRLTIVPKVDDRDLEGSRPVAETAEGADIAIENLPDPEAPAQAPAAVPDAVVALASIERRETLRIIEAMLFAASEPLGEDRLAGPLKDNKADLPALLADLQAQYASRGVNLVKVAGKWAFRTAADLSYVLERHTIEERRLSKAALETLAIVAYHQPVTRAEIEEIRGVQTSAGTLDILLEAGWLRPRGRRRAPGRPLTFGTTEAFLAHFNLDSIKDLPGLADLRAAGLLDGNLPPGFTVPSPTDVAALMPDELPLEAADEEPAQGEMELEDGEGDGEADGEAADAPAADAPRGE